jgi:hypothetical protein
MAKLTLTDLISAYDSITSINNNNTLIETAVENTLSRDGTSPNQMEANLDMNSKRILNLPAGSAAGDPVTVQQLADAATADITNGPATNITIADAGGYFDAVNVEGALQEVFTDLADVATGQGAALIGIEDAGGIYTGTDVEAALQEIGPASETTTGLVERATLSEMNTGTDTTRYISVDTLVTSTHYQHTTGTNSSLSVAGFTTPPTPTVVWYREGQWINVTITDFAATSNSANMSFSGLDADMVSTSKQSGPIMLQDNGVFKWGTWTVVNGGPGNMSFSFVEGGVSNDFTSSGTKGIGTSVGTYSQTIRYLA